MASWQKDAWQHIAVTWQDGASDNAIQVTSMHQTGYPATYAAIAPPTSCVGAGPPPEGASSPAWLDEVTVYNRALEATGPPARQPGTRTSYAAARAFALTRPNDTDG